jgi:nucleotide-binding universal stress UspA family protein
MLKHILVGVDRSEEAVDAIALAHYLAKRTGAKVSALSALPLEGVPPSERAAALSRDSEALFKLVRAAFKDVAAATEAVCDSSPSHALTTAAEETGASLIVVGSTHPRALRRLSPDSVAERLLTAPTCPVAVAPRGYSRRRHIGVGLIGVGYMEGPESRLALTATRELARDLDAAVRVIGVFDLLGHGSGIAGYHTARRGDVEVGLEDVAKLFGAEVEHETALLEGDPASVLAEQGIELDLLVVGSRGYGPVGRTLLGGVSAKVMRTAPCPVVAVPRKAEAGRDRSAGQADTGATAAAPARP